MLKKKNIFVFLADIRRSPDIATKVKKKNAVPTLRLRSYPLSDCYVLPSTGKVQSKGREKLEAIV
jgi:hypothetical protein